VFKKPPETPLTVKLYKLHGSLNWRRKHDLSVVRVNPEERTRGSKRYRENLLIYPAEKLNNEVERIVDPQKEPFGELHIRFRQMFKESKSAIFIGFNFRDEYINEIIKEEREGKKIIIVSPHATEIRDRLEDRNSDVIRIWGKNTKIIPIDTYFGKSDITNKIRKYLGNEN
jgi:hypothetical protein